MDGVGPLAEGVFSRSSFAGDAVKSRPAIPAVAAMFKAKTGKDLNDNTSREFMALVVLADAINRAKSTDGEKIRAALAATEIPGEQTIMPWKRIKFTAEGQNDDGRQDKGCGLAHDRGQRLLGHVSKDEQQQSEESVGAEPQQMYMADWMPFLCRAC